MRRFFLGAMGYSPRRFGRSRIGDLLDAMQGYNEAEAERVKMLIGVIRRATTLLWNTQVGSDDRRTAEELWPLPWDKDTGRLLVIDDNEMHRVIEAQKKFLTDTYPVN